MTNSTPFICIFLHPTSNEKKFSRKASFVSLFLHFVKMYHELIVHTDWCSHLVDFELLVYTVMTWRHKCCYSVTIGLWHPYQNKTIRLWHRPSDFSVTIAFYIYTGTVHNVMEFPFLCWSAFKHVVDSS